MLSEPTVLSIDNLSVCFKHKRGWFDFHPQSFFALRHVSLQLQRGSILAIVGESGSGKTTLAKCIAGLLTPTAGQIAFHNDSGNLVARSSKRHVQYVFQDPFASLNPGMTIEEVILEPLTYLQPRPSKQSQQKKLQAIFAQVGLDYTQRHRYPHEFSGGQCQRIAIARALIAEPDILINDEPVSALDVSVRAQVINLLRELNQTAHLSQIFIAHDLWLTRYLCHDMVVLYQGQVMESGPCQAIFESPQHPYTRALLDAIPHADPIIEKQRKRMDHQPASVITQTGCPYASRCERVQDDCRSHTPTLQVARANRHVACFYPVDD